MIVLLALQEGQVSSSLVLVFMGWAGDWMEVKIQAEASRPGHVCAHACVCHSVEPSGLGTASDG